MKIPFQNILKCFLGFFSCKRIRNQLKSESRKLHISERPVSSHANLKTTSPKHNHRTMPQLQEYYRGQAERFLKTVVLIDNNIESKFDIEEPPRIEKPITSEDVLSVNENSAIDSGESLPPATELKTNTDTQKEPDPQQAGETPSNQYQGDEPIDFQSITTAFARKKIVCALTDPSEEEDKKQFILDLAEGADVMVIDWKLEGSSSSLSLSVIKDRIRLDKELGGRLRLIVIYSGDKTEKIIETLRTEFQSDYQTENTGDDYSLLINKNCRISVFEKSSPVTSIGVKAKDLPGKVLDEFQKSTSGILPSAVLGAISEIREKSHFLLSRLPRELDGALILHRLLIPDPDDSLAYLADLVSDEILNTLRHSDFAKAISETNVHHWVDDTLSEPSDIKEWLKKYLSSFNKNIETKIINMFKNAEGNKQDLGKALKDLSLKIFQTEKQFEDSMNSFSMSSVLGLTRNTLPNFSSYEMRLTFGTIVFKLNDSGGKEFFMCIQPVCDTIRLKHDTPNPFPLLKLLPSKFGKGFCIEVQPGEIIWLKTNPKPNHIEIYHFTAHTKEEAYVKFNLSDDDLYCETISNQKFFWVADMKNTHAHFSVSPLASRMGTLGIDEFEWLRLSKKV